MSKLRLLLWPDCNRACPGCCNKDWDLDALPVCEDYSPYDNIVLTGGEPMLYPDVVYDIISGINMSHKVILYTADTLGLINNPAIVEMLDGLTLTLHDQDDVEGFMDLDSSLTFRQLVRKFDPFYLRANVFQGIRVPWDDTKCNWNAKTGMRWIKNCPLPKNEVLMKWNGES